MIEFFIQLQQTGGVGEIAGDPNVVWLLTVTFLIFFMQPGFALLEAGQVRRKNATNVFMKNMSDWSLGAVVYFLVGLSVAVLVALVTGGSAGALLADPLGELFGHLANANAYAGWLNAAVFAMTAVTIMSGAVAGRIRFRSYLVLVVGVTGVVYPVAQGMAWGAGGYGGLLTAEGLLGSLLGVAYLDFAGATVVHMVGGIAGLVAAASLGPRLDRYDENGDPNPLPGHSSVFVLLGTFVLAFGWYGFNVGTVTAVSLNEGTLSFNAALLGRVAVTTTLAMGAGAMASAMVTDRVQGTPDPVFTANGLLAGLVAVTGAAAFVTWWGAIVIGAIGGALVYPTYEWSLRSLGIDDVCGVFPVHGAAGAVGTLLVPLFGVGADGGWAFLGFDQLVMQVLGVGLIAAWTGASMVALLALVDRTVALRVSEDDERDGLDQSEHGTAAYPEFGVKGGPGDQLVAGMDGFDDAAILGGDADDEGAPGEPLDDDALTQEVNWRGETYEVPDVEAIHERNVRYRREVEQWQREVRRERAVVSYQQTLLADLREKLAKLGRGELDIEAGVPDPPDDFEGMHRVHAKFGQMDQQIQETVANIRLVVEQLPGQADQLDAKGDRIERSSESIDAAVNEIDALTDEIVDMARELDAETDRADTDVQDLSAALEEITATVAEIEEQSRRSTELATAGSRTAETAVEQIRGATAASDEAVERVERLSDKMGEVTEIAEVIGDIAERTNVLALNANIEASRVRDDGEGFGVVADEVKALAEEAKASAASINDITSEAEGWTDDVVESIEHANAELTEGADAVEDVVEDLEAIESELEATDTVITEITDTVDEQARNAETVNGVIEDVAERAEATRKLSERISSLSADQAEATRETAETAQDLNEIADEVTRGLDAFVLPDQQPSHS